MINPYDTLRARFMLYSDNLLFCIAKEDMQLNGYRGDDKFKKMTEDILNNFSVYGKFSEKQRMVIINYLIH